MRLLVALACVAFASAASEPKPIELPSPALPTVQTEEQTPVNAEVTLANLVKYVNSLLAAAAEEANPDAISIENPKLPEETSPEVAAIAALADEMLPVKVADSADPMTVIDGPIDMSLNFQYPAATPEQIAELLNTDRVQELPINDPEAMRKLFPNPMSLIDISPAYVSDDVMRDAMMRQEEMNTINVGGAHPFSFNNAEPVVVADNPADELDSKMDPVMVVESVGEQGSFAEMPKAPETVKVVDSVQIKPIEIPLEYFRGPERWRIPVPQEEQVPKDTWTIPREMWRGPPMQDNEPVYFRDDYNMPLPAYNDPALR